MKRAILLIAGVATLLSNSCKEDAEIDDLMYSYVHLKDITYIDGSGVSVEAEIMAAENQNILEYGFVWSESEEPTINDFKLSFYDELNENSYSGKIDNNLVNNGYYWVRPYIISNQFTVYGVSKKFQSKGCLSPRIDYFTPNSGKVGSQVKIKASHVNSNTSKTIVKFNGKRVPIISQDESGLTVEVPFSTGNLLISVTSGGTESFANDSFQIITPWKKITPLLSIEPHAPLYTAPYVFVINGKAYFCSDDELIEYDPATNQWTQKKKCPGVFRYNAVAFGLNNKGYYGLGHESYILYQDIWEYDPVLDDWKRIADYPGVGTNHVNCFPINNSFFVGMGTENNNTTKREFWEYDQNTQAWSRKADFPFVDMPSTIGFTLNNVAYFGYSELKKDFYKYDVASDSWLNICFSPGTEGYYAKTASMNNTGYMIASSTDQDPMMWEFNPSSNSWRQLINSPIQFHQSFTIGNSCYFFSLFGDLWRFDTTKL